MQWTTVNQWKGVLCCVHCILIFISSFCNRLGQSDEATMERKFTSFHQVRSTHLRQVLTTDNCHSYVTLGILLIIDSLLSLVLQVERRNQMVQVLLYLSYGRCVNWYLYIFPLNSADDVLWQTAMCSFKIPVPILKRNF